MKKLNKFMLFLAAAVFTLTACEENVERKPSPEDPQGAVAFTSAGGTRELNMQKEALEQKVTLIRTQDTDKAASLTLDIVSADDVFQINPEVNFAAGEKEASILVKFPDAESDHTYSFSLAIPKDKQSAYILGNTTFDFSVSLVNWTDPQVGVFTDFTLPNLYGFKVFSWYVNYIYDLKKDGSFKLRILEPFYKIAEADVQPDENGVYPYFIYNEPGDLMKAGDYNINIFVDANGVATVEDFSTGMAWSDGEISIHNYKEQAQGEGKFGEKVFFDIATKQMVVALGGELYNYAGFTFYFTLEQFLSEQVIIEPVDAEVSTYEGAWKVKAFDVDTDEPVEADVTVTSYDDPEAGQFYVIEGLCADVPTVYGYFDEDLHYFSIEYSEGEDLVTIDDVQYIPVFYPMTASGGLSGNSTLDFEPAEDGSLQLNENTAAIGYVIVYFNAADPSQYSFGPGAYYLSFEPGSADGAPRRAKAATRKQAKKNFVVKNPKL